MSSPNSQKTQNQLSNLGAGDESIAIRVKNVSKDFITSGSILPVLENISLSVKVGEIVSIVGKSGCGKTTLLNIISDLEKPTDGEASTTGRIGYVPQKDLLLPWRNVLENILLPIEIMGNVNQKKVSQARDLLREADLEQFGKAYPNEISGGMRQRVSLVRTLVQNPDTILFDEPFSAIDFDARLKLGKEIRSYIVSAGKTAIFVTHNIEEALSVGDQIIVLSSRPAKILYHSSIHIPEEYRDPVNIRKNKDFQNLFETIWKTMSY